MVVLPWKRVRRVTSSVMLVTFLQATLLPVGAPVTFAAEQRLSRILGTGATPSTAKGQKNVKRQTYVPGQVLVKFKNGVTVTGGDNKAVRSFAKARKMTFEDAVPGQNMGVLSVATSETVEKAVARLKADPNVEYAEPNYIRDIAFIDANDTYKDRLWALDNVGQLINGSSSQSGADINAPQAWAMSEGQQASPPIIVAVIDTGVLYTHSDLSGAMWDGSSCVDETGAALGGCIHGYDFADNDKNPLPVYEANFPYWHGTAVAGVIGATKNNGNGVIGIAPNVKIMALRFGLDTASEVKAIDFAIQNNAKVINASYGGSFFSLSESDAIDRFRAAGGLFVAAAGNSSLNNDSSPSYPASYTLSNIISVASTDQNDELSWFSNVGLTSVDVGAPGENLYATTVGSSSIAVVDENFESVTPPAMPAGFVVTGFAGTRAMTSGAGKVFYGDATHLPYAQSGSGTATVGPFDFSTTGAAHVTFDTRCDTQYDVAAYTDYMKLEASADGTTFTEIYRWDEFDLDPDGNPAGFSPVATRVVDIPAQYLTATARLRFRWITNGDANTGSTGDGCTVDNLVITKDALGGEGYSFVDGTSFSSPLTAGLAGLIMGYKPALTASEVKSVILASGDPLPSLATKTVTGKRINAEKALQMVTTASAGSLSVVRDTTPVRSRQLLGGTLEDSAMRLEFRAEGEDADVTWLVLTASGANAANFGWSVDRLELYDVGSATPFAHATIGGCGSDIVPPNSMCARMFGGQFIVSAGTTKDLIVHPRMRTDTDGAVSGHEFGFTIDPTPSASSGSLHARGVTSSNQFVFSDMDGTAEGEIMIGTQSLSAANVRINSLRNHVVLSQISSMTNASPDPHGTAIPTGVARAIGQFAFTTSAAMNFKNGSNKFALSGVIFNVQATNVQLGSGDNTSAGSSTFRLYNKDNPTVKAPCTAAATQESLLGQTGLLVVTCVTAGTSVNTEIDPGSDATFVLEADVVNSQISNTQSSLLQVSFTNFSSIDQSEFSPASSHISWMDKDSGSTSVKFGWIEYAETVVNSTAYGQSEASPDTVAPVIVLIGTDPVNITVGSVYVDAGATASDGVDGDITENIVVTNPVDTATIGTYIVHYNVSDAAGNAAIEVTRTVNVLAADMDIVPPVITLLGSTPVTVFVTTPYTDAGATASDNVDGDITANIVVTNPVDANVIGTYTVRYNVSDAAGNAATEVTRTVEVVESEPVPDTTPPVITLLGNLTVILNVGDIYVDAGATALDDSDGDITQNIVVTNPVNTGVAGTYLVRFNVSDEAGNAALEVARTVSVNAPEGSTGGDGGGSGGEPGPEETPSENGNTNRSPDPVQSNGGHRGHNTNVLFGKVIFIAKQNGLTGDIPPAAFGGAEVPLTSVEKQYICSMQRALPTPVLPGMIELVAAEMSGYIGRDAAYISEQMKSSTLCEEINISLRPRVEPLKVAVLPSFPVDKDGVPISTNPFWNMCIREAPMTFADLAKNPEVDSRGRHYSCDHYHRSEYGWRHPDLDMLFTWNPKTKQLRLPNGYKAEKSDQDLGYDPDLLIGALPKKEEELHS